MSRQVFRNNVFTKLAGAITDDQTVFQVADGSVFYSPGANEHAVITLQSKNIRSQVEVVQLVSVSGNTITVVRGIEGAQFAFAANDVVEQRVTAGSLDNFLQTEDVATSDTPPVNPRKDQRWIDSTDGAEYFWYDNGTSQQWVEVGTQVYGTDPAPPPAVTAYDMYQDQQAALISAVANTALSDAAAAQSTANTALSDAATAQSTANTALSDAATAQSAASTALSVAATAQSTASTALSAAATAQSTADTANGKADNNSACLGVSNAVHMGAFDGTLLPDNQPVKPLLQVLETRVERTAQVFNCVLNGATGTPSGGVDGYTFSDMNDLLAAMPDNCTINVEVTDFTGTWDATPVTRRHCTINININYYADAQKRGIVFNRVDSTIGCYLIDCDVTIHGEQEAYSVLRIVSTSSNNNVQGVSLTKSKLTLRHVTVEFANSANFAQGSNFWLFYQEEAYAKINQCTAVWDSVFTPAPISVQILARGIAGESWYDHDVDVSYLEIAYPTTLYYTGVTNRRYTSDSFTSTSPEPAILAVNRKNVFSLSATGRVMQNITSAMLKLTCTSANLNYAVGDEIYFALGGSGTSEGNEKGAYLVGNRAGTKQIVELWLFIGAQGLTHVRNTPAYNVELLDLTKWSAVLYCRDES